MVEVINPVYLKAATIQQINTHFQSNSDFKNAYLKDFFTDEGLEYIMAQMKETEFVDDSNQIVYRRGIGNIPAAIEELLESDTFLQLTERIVGEPVSFVASSKIHRYSHRDYKIIHDDAVMEPGYDLFIDLTPEWKDKYGGYISYTDGEGQFFTIESNFGSIVLVKRDRDLHYFIKYVNHYAENLNRYLVIGNSTVG